MISEQQLNLWFPRQPQAALRPADTRARLICFHSAGSDSSLFLSLTIRRQPVENELLQFCKDRRIQLLCPLMPGRTFRHTEDVGAQTIYTLVKALLTVLLPLFRAHPRPLFVAGHSLGSLFTFFFTKQVLEAQLPAPRLLVFTASIAPCRPPALRPWTPAADLSDEEFKESMRRWNIAEEALNPRIWPAFHKMIWQDIDLIDRLPQSPPLKLANNQTRLLLIRGKRDLTITQEMVEEWRAAFDPPVSEGEYVEIDGDHAIFYDKRSRSEWNAAVIERMASILEESDSEEEFVTGF